MLSIICLRGSRPPTLLDYSEQALTCACFLPQCFHQPLFVGVITARTGQVLTFVLDSRRYGQVDLPANLVSQFEMDRVEKSDNPKKLERNPSWMRDELILALELYRRHQGNPPGKNSKEVVELSSLLNKMGAQLANGKADFRNPNGVYMKVMNFRRFDPLYLSQGKKGLERGGKLEAEIWSTFADKQSSLAETAAAIRANVEAGSPAEVQAEDMDEAFEAEEGRILARAHLARERSRKLVEQKKSVTIKNTGKLACEVCAFEFESAYGKRGAGFIEAHHIKPVHTLMPGQKTKLEDLALLCSNCHRMIHARKPWLTVEQLRQQLKCEGLSLT